MLDLDGFSVLSFQVLFSGLVLVFIFVGMVFLFYSSDGFKVFKVN